MRAIKRPCMNAVAVFLFAATALAQNNTGTITGSATDTGHLPVPGTSIQIKNLETGAVHTAATGLLGNYNLPQLPPGRYQLTATSPGFKPYERKDVIAVQGGQTQRVDIPMGDFISLETLGEDRLTVGAMFLSRAKPPAGPTPHMPDGKPDFSGLWYGPTPSSSRPDLQPWAEAVLKERTDNNLKDAPGVRCLPFNILPLSIFLNRIVQTRDALVTVIEYDIPGYRQIYLDGRGHPKDLELSWTGHSTGTWDGDTLIIDTVGFNDKTWIGEGTPHTEKLHLTSRVRRPDLGHLEIETTFDDPGAFLKPWTVKGVATLAPAKEEIADFICTENNQDVEHLVGK
jgi:Carboxypeptidase regulatory-like domain